MAVLIYTPTKSVQGLYFERTLSGTHLLSLYNSHSFRRELIAPVVLICIFLMSSEVERFPYTC